jgi:acyl-CoA synthetase (AMP-forming)/AMP-acid ligase II
VPASLNDHLHAAATFARTGMFRPQRPDRTLRAVLALQKWGPTLAAGYEVGAARYPSATAIVDELGTLTFAEVNSRGNSLANALAARGVKEGDGIAILCRNHRGFVDASLACSKLGAAALYLNTAFAEPQVAAVMEQERPAAVIYDQDLGAAVMHVTGDRPAFVGWREAGTPAAHPSLEDLIAAAGDDPPRPPSAPARAVILTSGTTGTPKGANRAPHSLEPAAQYLSRIPLRAREPLVIAAPLFHSWGFAHLAIGTMICSTLVLRRRFDPEAMLSLVSQRDATGLIVIPVMLQRTLELSDRVIAGYDTSSLRAIVASGSALPGPLAQRVMDALGDKLYNLYGSTEVAWATIAGPEDLRAAPGTAGRPPRGTIVKILDRDGNELPAGSVGGIFVGSELLFDGYTSGDDKRRVGALMSTGDVGHFDSDGRLFVDGRDDEMIISGGENVFPVEVEELLAHVPGIREVAVVGVPDDEFGQRLRAFVVPVDGANLTEQQLQDHVRSNLARYKVPREVVFVEQLPRNATGKILKRELQARE